jgi:AbrB family looped-hinge helix DNA binding protein
MAVTVKIDRQGRVVIPQGERERLGVRDGGALELLSTPEGLLLEQRRPATVSIAADGLPLVTIEGSGTVSNDDTIAAIHRQRARA